MLERHTRHARETQAEYPGVPYLLKDTPAHRRLADRICQAVSGMGWYLRLGHICIEETSN